MSGNEPIRFGLMGYGKNYHVDVRNFDRFAQKGITLDELKEAVGRENIKNMPLFEKMFASIAKDDLLDANELFGYFKQLDKAAELNEKNLMLSDNELLRSTGEELGDILQANELSKMEKFNGHVGKKPDIAEMETMHQFVNALIQKNDEKVQAEMQEEAEIAAQEAQRLAEAEELASRTTVDPKTGNVTVVDKDNPINSETRDKDGNLVKRTFEDDFYWSEATDSPSFNDATVTEIYNKNGKVVQRIAKGKYEDSNNPAETEIYTLTEKVNPFTGEVQKYKFVVKDASGNQKRVEEKTYIGKPIAYMHEEYYEDENGHSWTENVKDTFTPYKGIELDSQNRIVNEFELNSEHEKISTEYQYNKDGTTSAMNWVEYRKYNEIQTDANGQVLYDESSMHDDNVYVNTTRYYKDGEVFITKTYNEDERPHYECLYKNDKISLDEYYRLEEQIQNYYKNMGLNVGRFLSIRNKD